MENISLKTIQCKLSVSCTIYENYAWLLNCYVLDFFTDNHWNKLPKCWQKSLKNLDSHEISKLLNYNKKLRSNVWPLSILALHNLLSSLSLPRKIVDLNIQSPFFTKDDKLLKLFWKNVKAKKRHEISICYDSALKTDCFHIVDIGSGLGHLSRILNYGYGFKVCTIEAQELLSQQAQNLDNEFETVLERKFPGYLKYNKNVHINKRIQSNITANEFLTLIKSAINSEDDDFKFGIVGLHPCGDLGATLLKLYTQCPEARFINIVGCCYMKLSTLPGLTQGFPLSQFCKLRNYNLSYHSREIACHAIENYIEKLNRNECWRLKIHTYRAALEKIIAQKCPKYRHSALNNVKYSEDLTFENYCHKATKKLNIDFSDVTLQSSEIEDLLAQWREVVVFYSLRLLFAPLIESIIHLDRLLFVEETGSAAQILPVFDAQVSPRTHVLTARKK
ncbi:protein RRNAD1 isoform X2 [Tribolium madens]|uniref:protein RRNAD1 isoform X2 n=1 Tax=Tribolium madens TaxID=41895 RepID=UPI001CF742AB|nr:protein RRNAD1 isoform X2 [Tribolium madens]